MRTRAQAFLTALLLAAGLLLPHPASAGLKRLIEMGWDEPDPAFMLKHVAEMEAMPFDGCVYHIGGLRPDGELGNFGWACWGTRVFTEQELAADLATMRSISFRRFRSNFVRMNVTPANIDWFDDHSAVFSNLTLGASFAKRAGSAGIMLDTEQYEGPLFDYTKQRDRGRRSYAEYAAQARKRGSEAMRAIEKGYPGITLFLTLGVTHTVIQTISEPIALDKGPYGLLAPFVDGMVLAASDSAKIVDGLEGNYPSRTPAQVENYVGVYDTAVVAFVTDMSRFRRVTSRSWGFWLDYDWRTRGWNETDGSKNYQTPASLQKSIRRALELADDYVWIWVEKPHWWSDSGRPTKLPPGYVQALRNARKGLAP